MADRKTQIQQQMAGLLQDGCVILDLETTGFVHPDVEIIEIGIVDHTGAVLMDTLVKPARPIPAGASRVNGIYDKDVAESPSFIEVMPEMMRHLSGQPVVAYNAPFEEGILDVAIGRFGLSWRVTDWVCAMRGYARYKSLSRFARLTNACHTEAITVANAHRAVGDCVMTLELIRKMAGHAE